MTTEMAQGPLSAGKPPGSAPPPPGAAELVPILQALLQIGTFQNGAANRHPRGSKVALSTLQTRGRAGLGERCTSSQLSNLGKVLNLSKPQAAPQLTK